MPYYFYYTEQIVVNVDSKNNTYCFTNFPNFTIEVTITLYTICISYVLPLLTIIFCYIGMMKKFLKKSGEQNMLEHSIKFSNLNSKSKSLYVKRSNNNYDIANDTNSRLKSGDEHSETASALLNVSTCLLEKHSSLNDIEIKNKDKVDSFDNMSKIFSRFSFKRTLTTKLSSNSQQSDQNENLKKAKQKKTKVLILIGAVSITFALTWLPAHIIQIWRIIFNKSFPFNDLMYIIKVVAHTLSYSNSFINPFIYIFVGSKFKSHIKEEINRLCGIKTNLSIKRQSQQNSNHLNGSRNYLDRKSPLIHKPKIVLQTSVSNNENIISYN